VLIVDDNAANRSILEKMLMRWDMKPALAASGPEALEFVRSTRTAARSFGLILTDVNMPGMDGFTFVEQLWKTGKFPEPVIMMLTTTDQSENMARCLELGVTAHLVKPIPLLELKEAILKALGGPAMRTEPDPADSPHQLRRAPSDGTRRVLVAEDNVVNQLLAVRLLEKQGYRPIVVDNGEEVLARLEKEPFDVILMDLQMPRMTGFEATERIRQLERSSGHHIPIVAMTAHAMKGDCEECLQRGMDAYISKPIRPQELFDLLAGLLAGEEVLHK